MSIMLLSMLFLFQGELFIGDQNGSIHVWDLKTDNNEQVVRKFFLFFPVACIYSHMIHIMFPTRSNTNRAMQPQKMAKA